MRVRVAYTVDVGEFYRRAINHHYGRPGLATRAQVRSWLEMNGSQGDDDLVRDLDQAIERERESSPFRPGSSDNPSDEVPRRVDR